MGFLKGHITYEGSGELKKKFLVFLEGKIFKCNKEPKCIIFVGIHFILGSKEIFGSLGLYLFQDWI